MENQITLSNFIKKAAVILAVFLMFALLAWAFFVYNKPQNIDHLSNIPSLQKGDWVLRMGSDSDSLAIAYLSNSNFSHIAIVVEVNEEIGNTQLVDAISGEKSIPDSVRQIALRDFLSPEKARHWIILRPYFLNNFEKNDIVQIIKSEIGKPFILKKREENPRYCTTLLRNAIAQIHPQFKPRWQRVDFALVRGDYLFPQAFVEYQNIQTIAQSP